jgi:cob(I)alamin adenosyltransferase
MPTQDKILQEVLCLNSLWRCSLLKIYTRRGDEGETGLLYGGRVSKSDLRCEAYGTIDEAVSALGLARSLVQEDWLRELIMKLQRELFVVGGELATDPAEYSKLEEHFSVVTPVMVDRLETLIDELNDQMTLPNAFIIPGATPASGALDMARSILRRAERRVVTLKEEGLLHSPVVLQYLNRLADLAFVMARYEDRHLPIEALTGETSARAGTDRMEV